MDTRSPVDGRDLSELLKGAQQVENAEKPFFFFYESELRAVRQGRWKLQIAHTDVQAPDIDNIGNDGVRGSVRKMPRAQALYDLEVDPGESKDLSSMNPEVLDQMLKVFKTGSNIQPPSK